MIERERIKLRQEEHRINSTRDSANEKLIHCERREKDTRDVLEAEFERLQSEAKRNYSEAASVTKKLRLNELTKLAFSIF